MEPAKITFPITTPFNCNNATDEIIDDNYELVTELFVSKGFSGGPALTPDQFIDKVNDIKHENFPLENIYWAITDEGQFQCYVGIYVKS